MSTVIQFDKGNLAMELFHFPQPLLSLFVGMMHPPPLMSSPLALNLVPMGLESTRPTRPTRPSSTIQVNPSTGHLTTMLEMFHAAIDMELTFLKEHQLATVRCFNNNMIHLAQCGMAGEILHWAQPALGKWGMLSNCGV
jgi:hypothetical protein